MENLARDFEAVYDATFDKVVHFVVLRCASMDDVKDIVQEVYAEFYKILQKQGLEYFENPQAFLFRIAKFKLFRHYHVAKRLKNRLQLLANQKWQEEELAEVSVDGLSGAMADEVWQSLKQKDVWTQKIFYLHFYADLPLAQIAEKLGLSQSVVKHKLYDTLLSLRSFYQKEDV